MPPADIDSLQNMVAANDKLLKALVTLLAIKDEHLLNEMGIVFSAAAQTGSKIGQADASTWAHIRKELAMIGELVDHVEESEQTIDRPAVNAH